MQQRRRRKREHGEKHGTGCFSFRMLAGSSLGDNTKAAGFNGSDGGRRTSSEVLKVSVSRTLLRKCEEEDD